MALFGCRACKEEISMGTNAAGGDDAIPDEALWTSPLSWMGTPLHDAGDYSRAIPIDATYTRGEIIATFSRERSPGVFSESQVAFPALIKLAAGKAVEVYWQDDEPRRWTYRAVKQGRKTVWVLFSGPQWPGVTEADASTRAHMGLERTVVQSVLPLYGSREFISVMIDSAGKAVDMATHADPDPND